MGLGDRFRKGALWSYAQGWISGLASFAGGVIMARLLEPEEFGLFATVTAYTAIIGRQLQLGIPEALLRTPEGDDGVVNSGFWTMQALALGCALGGAVAAPWLGKIYGSADLVPVMWAMTALYLLQPLSFSSQSVLRRSMRHDVAARILLVSSLAGTLTAIVSAAGGLGVYAFVASSLVSSLLLLVMSLGRSGWRPAWSFDSGKARGLVGYGWRIHAANSLELAADRMDAMLIGRVLDFQALGIYRRADSTAKLAVTELLGRLYSLIFALFARLSGDIEGSRRAFRKLCTAVLAPIFLVLAWIWISLGDFISFLYGEKWLPAVPYAKVLVVAAVVMSIRGLLAMYLNASGHAGKQAGISLLDLCLTAALISIGLQWGLLGAAWAMVLRYVVLLGITMATIRRHAEIQVMDVVSGAWPAFLTLVAVMAVLLATGWAESIGSWCAGRACALALKGLLVGSLYMAVLAALRRLFPANEGLEALFGILRQAFARLNIGQRSGGSG